MLWEVWRGEHFIGIVESNYGYAVKYWTEMMRLTGEKYKLKEMLINDPTAKTSIKQ